MTKMSHCNWFWLSLYAGAIDIKLPKSQVVPHFDCVKIVNAVRPLTVPSIICCQRKWCHMTIKSHISSDFNELDVRNAVVPFMMLMPAPMASNDQKSYIVLHFDCLDLGNVVVPLTVPSALCDIKCQCQWFHMAKTSCWTSFWSHRSKEWDGIINNVIGNTWHQCYAIGVRYQKVMLCLILIMLN